MTTITKINTFVMRITFISGHGLKALTATRCEE
jgi:hypothetical protein